MIDALQSKSGRVVRLTWGILLAIILITAGLFLDVQPCHAQDEPDDVNMERAMAFGDLISDNDTLFVATYDIQFAVEQDYDIDEAFIFNLLDSGDTILGSTIGNSVYNQGYGAGGVSFYFESGLTWGETYTFRVMENPVIYPSPQYWDFTIGESEYSDEDDLAEALKAEIMDSAVDLSTVFDVVLY